MLFGQSLDAPLSLLLVRLFGAPLISLAVLCWAAGAGVSGGFVRQTVEAMLIYNGIVSVVTRVVAPRAGLASGRRVINYSGEPVTGIEDNAAPNLLNTSYAITAEIDVPEGGAEGNIVSEGGRFGGYGLYLLKGKPVFTWNLLDLKRVKWEGPDVLAPGKHTLVYDFKYDGLGFATLAFNNVSGLGHPGTGVFSVDGKVVATQILERTIPITLPIDETFDIGSKTGTPVDDADYQVPFAFTGKIDKLTISVAPPVLTEDDKKKLMEAEHAAQDAN